MTVTPEEFKARYGRPRPTERERQAAARVVARGMQERGEAIPDWIRELAAQGPRGIEL